MKDLTVASENLLEKIRMLDSTTENRLATFDVAPPLAVNTDADAFRLISATVERLCLLVEEPLVNLRQRPGPEPRISLRWLVREICIIWIRETGQAVTSSPVEGYQYTGKPQSPAGKFVLEAVKALCPSSRTSGDNEAARALFGDQTVHLAIQGYVRDHPLANRRRRSRPKQGCATI